MIRDANKPLGKEVAEAIVTKLDKQLTEIGWRCNILHVFEDYVYLVADVPADTLSHEILPELKRRSAEIAFGVDNAITTDNLWADSYLVLTPGRELHISEIQRFINFSGVG
jgi:REP element-mobilizing transposase RayT